MISQLPNFKATVPRQPRVIVYDVDAEMAPEDILIGLAEQNPELNLTKDDLNSMSLRHKLGPRTGSTTHWVIDVPAKILNKVENRSVFLGLTRCRVKPHYNIP